MDGRLWVIFEYCSGKRFASALNLRFNRSKLILNSVMDQPMVAGEKALQNNEALWEMYQSTPDMQNELKDVQVLWNYMNLAFQLHFTKKKVENLKELQNTVISADGATQAQLLRLLGAAPEAMPMQPLVGTVELEGLMIVILVYCSVAYTQMTGNHMPF